MPQREHWLIPVEPKEDAGDAIRELKYCVDHLYHQADLIHVFHCVPDIKTIRGARKLDPKDEENAKRFFQEHLEPVLLQANANYVYEVAHATDSSANISRSIGEVIDIRATDINATATIIGRRHRVRLIWPESPSDVARHGLLGLGKDSGETIGTITKYLLKHSSQPVCVLPPGPGPDVREP